MAKKCVCVKVEELRVIYIILCIICHIRLHLSKDTRTFVIVSKILSFFLPFLPYCWSHNMSLLILGDKAFTCQLNTRNVKKKCL